MKSNIFVVISLFVILVNSSEEFQQIIKPKVSELKAINCILEYYKIHTEHDIVYPGSLISYNLFFGRKSEFETVFLNKLSDPRQNYFNSTFFIQLFTKKQHKPFQMMPKISKYIVLVSSAREMRENIESWKLSPSWNQLAPVFILLQATLPRNQILAAIPRIFKALHQNDLRRSYLIYVDIENSYVSLIVRHPNEGKNYKLTNIERERCYFYPNMTSQEQVPKSILSPEKERFLKRKFSLKNFDLLPFKVSVRIYPPYVMFVNNTSGGIFTGAEVFLVKLFAAEFNMTLDIEIKTSIDSVLKG